MHFGIAIRLSVRSICLEHLQRFLNSCMRHICCSNTGIPYDATCSDVWSLGVLLFAMVTGQFPFDDSNKKHLLRETTSGKVNFGSRGSNLSEQVKDLIKKLLTPDVKTRITLEEALDHPWMNRRGSHLHVPSSWRSRSRSINLPSNESSEHERIF